MTIYEDYSQTDSLEDVTFIAGTDFQLEFPLYNETGNAININASTMKWLLGYYNNPNIAPIIEKTGVAVNDNTFVVTLSEGDTINLGDDVYIQQMVITDTAGKKVRPAQGKVIIRKAIPES